MLAALDVLIVDDRPDSVRFLAEFLLQRCRRVDVTASAREAMSALVRRRAAKEPYHLVISDFAMPEADGLSLLRELRQRQDDTPFVFVTGYRALNPEFEPEAKRLGALAILDKPVDLRQVEDLLGQATAVFRRKRDEQAGDQPFFGTSRTLRKPTGAPPPPSAPSSALEPRLPRDQTKPITTAWRNPQLEEGQPSALEPRTAPPPPVSPAPAVPATGYQRRPSQIMPMGGTARLRRSVAPVPPANPGTARVVRGPTAQPPTAFTARVRRGVEGTAAFNRPGAEPARTAEHQCTACGRGFVVVCKAQEYTTVCLHCGQLQRIPPG